jgi:hypothetical protein
MRFIETINGVRDMKIILDVDQVVREMNLSSEVFAKWKAANLDQNQEGGNSRWPALEESGFLDLTYPVSTDLKTG